MLQKEIWLIDFEPTKGREQQGIRPSVIISGNAMNKYAGLSIVCPLTTKIKSYPGSYLIKKNKENHLTADSEVLVFQVKAVTHERFRKKVGMISEDELESILEELNNICRY